MPPESPSEVLFVPGTPPRAGHLAVWRPGGDTDRETDGERLQVVTPAGRTLRTRSVPVRRVPLDAAVELLTGRLPDHASQTLRAWSAAANAGLALIARGRLLPATEDGLDAWRVGPLDPADARWLTELAGAMPPLAHALPIPRSRPLRIRSAAALVRDLWDALADTLVRTAAAPLVGGSPLFAAAEPQPVAHLAAWLAQADAGLDESVTTGVRIHLPTDDEAQFRGVLQLRSTADPSLVVDVADLWDAPAAVLARLGTDAETELLLALRRGARAWPPLAPALTEVAPQSVPLDDDAVADLLGDGAAALGGAGIEVLWPAELLTDSSAVRLRAVATPSPGAVTSAGLGLDDLLELRWEATLDGNPLTEDELSELAEAKRPLVRMRGHWVAADPALLARLRRARSRPQPLRAVEALAAALTGTLRVDGESVEFAAGGALRDLADRLGERSGSHPAELPEPPGLEATLRPYQRRGLAWLALMCELGLGGCLADDMGLGKTIQVIALHLHRHRLDPTLGATLVVCPTSLLGTWERELHRFAPQVRVRRYHAEARDLADLPASGVVLTTYGVLRRDRAPLAGVPWGTVVADEAQHAKNPMSRTARELRALPGGVRIALSGTPVENRLTELWAVLDWTTPGLLGQLEPFRRNVAVPVERHRDPDATVRLARLVRPFLLRRTKRDPAVAPELPPKTETDRVVALSAEQATLYAAVVKETLARIESSEGIERRGLVLSLLTALKQICNHPAQYLRQQGPLPGRSGKLDALDDLLDVVCSEGESTLVFTQYVAMARLLEQHLARRGVGTLFLHGGVPAARRERMVQEFQDGEAPVFLLSLKAGGTGLTLTRATHVVHFDRWWNPAVEDQATDRAYRIGQDRPVQVHRLVTEGTVEDRIATLLGSKRELADAVVGGGEAWLTELDDAGLRELVSLGGPSGRAA